MKSEALSSPWGRSLQNEPRDGCLLAGVEVDFNEDEEPFFWLNLLLGES